MDGRTRTAFPAWYAQRHSDADPVSFAEAIRALPRAVDTKIAYNNPYTDEWIPTDRFNAIVDPERLERQAAGDTDTDPLFHVPTDSYAVITPTDVYAPLEEVLRAETHEGRTLGELVFGEIRQYRGGGEIHMDILFDGLSVTLPERNEPITMGVTSGYDFFGGHAVYVEGFARDSYCANSIRQLTDRQTVKHVGEVGDFRSWWETVLAQLGLIADDLAAFIDDASEITVDFTQVPFDVTEFYELLEFPTYLATQAASDARAAATTPTEIDLWTLHSGATYALTHFFNGKEGAALDRYVRRANDILFNPEATVNAVTQTYEQQAVDATTHDGQTGLDSQVALAQLDRVGQEVRAKATRFERREAALRARLSTITE
nr:hypothetical protein [Haloplanus aerogenes]